MNISIHACVCVCFTDIYTYTYTHTDANARKPRDQITVFAQAFSGNMETYIVFASVKDLRTTPIFLTLFYSIHIARKPTIAGMNCNHKK